MKTEKFKARIIIRDKCLGKRLYEWNVPEDLEILAKRLNKTFIGIGHWLNKESKKFICIAYSDGKLIYIDEPLWTQIKMAYNLDGVQYLPKKEIRK